jgi:phage tail sheath protein FI
MTVPLSYPGVYIEEIRSTVKVIRGVETSVGSITGVVSKVTPSSLLAAGYQIVETKIEQGGLAILFGKANEHVLVRMSDYREGNSIEGHMVVTFVGKLP